MQVTSGFVVLAPLTALILGAVGIGGGIYETVLVDRVWPANPAMIQPGRGGINRALFWGPVQTLYELALLVAAWMVWNIVDARWWIIVALAAHFATRAWSFAYFIPRALRFEKLGDLTEEQRQEAQRWIRLSRARPVLEALAVMAQCMVVLHLAMR
jgi:hypothetical protein